jgi:antibiotic biosynthesis monooxygenase (ABM) superfamily enzyme
MQNFQPPSEPITVVISEIIDPNRIKEYEAWTRGINQAAQQFDGFLGVEIIRPRDHDYPEYVVIVKFDQYRHFRQWITSPIYQQWIDKGHAFVADRVHQYLPNGLELWFSLPNHRQQQIVKPAYYKQVILGVLAVYPLIVLSNLLLNPLLSSLPAWLGLFISVVFISALLTYPVMPWLTKHLSFWLYPSVSKRAV